MDGSEQIPMSLSILPTNCFASSLTAKVAEVDPSTSTQFSLNANLDNFFDLGLPPTGGEPFESDSQFTRAVRLCKGVCNLSSFYWEFSQNILLTLRIRKVF